MEGKSIRIKFDDPDALLGCVLVYHQTRSQPAGPPDGMYAEDGFYGKHWVQEELIEIEFFKGTPAEAFPVIMARLEELKQEYPNPACMRFDCGEGFVPGMKPPASPADPQTT